VQQGHPLGQKRSGRAGQLHHRHRTRTHPPTSQRSRNERTLLTSNARPGGGPQVNARIRNHRREAI
jgi:hypothetical protein